MKKSAVYAAFAVVCMVLAVGCEKKVKTELRVLNYYDMTMASAEEELSMVWRAFEKANPDITIIREDLFNEAFHDKTESYAAAGQIPDVLYAWPSGRSASLHTKGLLKDLGPLLRKDAMASYYIHPALDPSLQVSGYLGILSRAITVSSVLYVNMEVLDECGLKPAESYEELKAQAPALKAKGYDTILMANAESWVMQSCLFSLIAGRFCGEGWEQDILSGTKKFTDPEFVNALNFVQTMYEDRVLDKDTLITDYGTVIGEFAANKGAYLIDGDWRIAAFIANKATGDALIPVDRQKHIRAVVFPDIPGTKFNDSTSVILGTGWGMSAAIEAGSPKENAAWRLIKWLTGKKVQAWLLETGGMITPTRNDINTGGLKLEPIQITVEKLEFDKSTAVIDGAFPAEVYTPINEGLQLIGTGAAAPRQVAEAVQAALEAWRAGQ